MEPAGLHLISLVSAGHFSSVFLASRGNDTELLALKVFPRAALTDDQNLSRKVLREKQILAMVSQLPHPFIVGFRYAHLDDERLYLAMDHVGGGDLESGTIGRGTRRVAASARRARRLA